MELQNINKENKDDILNDENDVDFIPTENNFEDEKNLLKQFKNLYNDKKKIMSAILGLYKFMQIKNIKQIYEKTENDVNNDIASAKFNLCLDKMVKETHINIINAKKSKQLFYQKLELLPQLLDFCWVYFLKSIADDIPSYKLPMNLLKFGFIVKLMKIDREKYGSILCEFENVIKDKFFCDVRRECPPFFLTTDLSYEELMVIYDNKVKPTIKKIIEVLLKMTSKTVEPQSAEPQNTEPQGD